jgi:hypothetical protein
VGESGPVREGVATSTRLSSMSGPGWKRQCSMKLLRAITWPMSARVPVRYTDDAGQVHEADVQVLGRFPAGTAVQLWVDRAGRLTPAPPRDGAVSGAAVRLGVAATAGWLLLVVASTAVRRVVDARNAATWARDWETVEPDWTGRPH